ncbi:hypothetical protein GLYMA_11G172800v4 [Glycine max]|uniref:Uncharacterized protein n=2 Tax=Glycine subgen. Soja TaxID=1462606 RepID=K7LQU8_SOYBN|nr:hypothetical protein GYH30_031546 [Glycine max]KRH30282.1 hypothetical protein GLYMA_11G172800v4 [Glycine max]
MKGQLSVTVDAAVETVSNKLGGLSIGENSGKTAAQGSTVIWKRKSYGTASGGNVTEVENGAGVDAGVASTQKSSGSGLSKIFCGNFLKNFTYSRAQVRATFYPKFENEKADQEAYSFCHKFSLFRNVSCDFCDLCLNFEVRTRMIELVAKGLATIKVQLSHLQD